MKRVFANQIDYEIFERIQHEMIEGSWYNSLKIEFRE